MGDLGDPVRREGHHRHDARAKQAEQGHREIEGVVQLQHDPLSGAQPGFDETGGAAQGGGAELGVGERARPVGGGIGQRRGVGSSLGGQIEAGEQRAVEEDAGVAVLLCLCVGVGSETVEQIGRGVEMRRHEFIQTQAG